MTILLTATEITKSFGPNLVLKGVTLSVAKGEVLAVVGENGAGKSTLMKILSGVYATGSYGGQLAWEGRAAAFGNPAAALRAGIALIHQEIQLVQELSVAANLFLGREQTVGRRRGFIDQPALDEAARAILSRLKAPVEPTWRVGGLSISQQQLVEIAKALSTSPRLLIFDEPTSSLTEGEVVHLFDVIRELKAAGTAILYISHKMEEIQQLADSVVVLRDGESVSSGPIGEFPPDRVIREMVGRRIDQLYPKASGQPGEPLLEVEALDLSPAIPGRRALRDVSLTVRRGEVLGLAGLVGAGRSELLEYLFGALPGKVYGSLRLNGRSYVPASPARAMAAGVALVTEDRKGNGLVLQRSVADNLTLANLPAYSPNGWIRQAAEQERVRALIGELAVRTSGPGLPVGSLSGGNQQKVVLGKWLDRAPQLLLLDEPTRGVDVGAKAEIYGLIRQLADRGIGVIMASSELPEVLGLSDRVAVMADGRVRGILDRAQATPEAVMQLATGGQG